MAALKLALFLCAIVFASQAQASPVVKDDGIVDIIKKLVNWIESLLDKIVVEITRVVGEINDDFDAIQKKIVDLATKSADASLDVIYRLMEDLSQDSNEGGKKLINCIIAARPDILAVVTATTDSTSKCVENSLLKLTGDLKPVLVDVNGVYDKVKESLNGLDNCSGNDVTALLCVVQVASDVFEILKTLPDVVNPDLAPIKDDAIAFRDSFKTCWQDYRPTLFSSAAKVVDQAAVCASS